MTNLLIKTVENFLIKYNILIKDLTSKVSSEFVRIAVRNTVENNKLIAALHEEFK